MAAYVVAETEIVDPVLAQRYRDLAQQSVAEYGGRFIVRGGAVNPVEGDWQPRLYAIVEFHDMAQARKWYDSPQYAEALEVRQTALRRRLMFVEGVPSDDAST